jgi:site-specific DNA-methyltransferase (adenine-specific)
MTDQEQITALYDVLDKSASLYSEKTGLAYLEGLVRSAENIVAGQAVEDDEGLSTRLADLMSLINDVEFSKEAIRKAFQLAVLKGLKAGDLPLETMTPDTVGIFIAYLINKFYDIDKPLILFDPLVGTGNLLAAVANSRKQEPLLFGVDHNDQNLMLCRSLLGMLEFEDNIYYQDTLSFSGIQADAILTDVDRYEMIDGKYFPYELLKQHWHNLKAGGMVFAVIFEEFFQDSLQSQFKSDLLAMYHPIGLIRLPDDLFTKYRKSILIMEKPGEKAIEQEFLMASLPSFIDKEALRNTIDRINDWFDDRIRKEKQ